MKIDIEYLRENEACAPGVTWFMATFPKGEATLAAVLKAFTTDESDYYSWIIKHLFNREQVIWLACLAARRALRFVPKGEMRPLACIETVEAFVKGEKTLEDVRKARQACWEYRAAAYAAYADAADAAAYAAYAAYADAADAAAYAADAAADADAAAYAAYAAYADAADAAAYAAYAAYADAAAAAAAARRKEWAEIMAAVAAEVIKASFKKLGKVPAGTLK